MSTLHKDRTRNKPDVQPKRPGLLAALYPYDRKALARFDAIIDVRSPAEFAEDRLPGAVNLPVLSNEERARIGAIYVQESKFRAKRLGAAIVARNIAAHLETALADMPPGWAPLVYCWRGGQRSNAFALVMTQVGWRTTVLTGGYQTYRRHVQARLYADAPEPSIVLLDGNTGTGKTAILARLAERGVQTIDLECLAAHRGSIFGGLAQAPQPSQKQFESALLDRLEALDPARPIVAEAESSKIGARIIPPLLWRAMRSAPRIELSADPDTRARHLVEAYPDLMEDAARLDALLTQLVSLHGHAQIDEWRELAQGRAFERLARALIEAHYDPTYARSRKRHDRETLGRIEARTLDDAGQNAATDAAAAIVTAYERR